MTKKKESTKPAANKKNQRLEDKKMESATRKKILTAAKKVFGENPYHSASIRAIGKEAGIEHPLINYYFPAKSDLFSAVISELEEHRLKHQTKWLKEAREMDPHRGFSTFLDKVLDYYNKYPQIFRTIALNLVQTNLIEQIPAYDIIQASFKRDIEVLRKQLKMTAPQHEIEMFSHSVSTLMISYLGAANCYATLLNMDPDSFQYLNWVKETVVFALLPRLKKMFQRVETITDTP
ncbi:TetR/AcrR family transcriptional regulator [bacterium]|nr:TetR/AcrR family transcriptional regulator [bacterium]